jgi:hypothetical protein
MTIYYVGKGGNDGNDGESWATRRLTLNSIENLLAAGDTLYIGPGTYRETWTIDQNGSSGQPIVAIGDQTGENTDGVGGTVRITASDNDYTAVRNHSISATSKDYRTFRGLTLDFGWAGGTIDTANNCDNWIIEDCTIGPQYSNDDGCIFFGGLESGFTLTVRRCRLISGDSHIDFQATAEISVNVLIENCILEGGWSWQWPYDINLENIYGVTVNNCTFLDGTNVYVSGVTAGNDNFVYNSLFQHGPIVTNADNVVEDYNVFEQVDATDPIDSDITPGANTVKRPLMFMPPVMVQGVMYPVPDLRFAPWSTIPDLACDGNSASDDFYGVPRPTADAKKTRGAIQHQSPERETTIQVTGESVKLPDAMYHQILVPITGKQMTFKVKVHREASYTGTNPQMIIRQPGQSARTTTDVGAASQFNQLSDTFTPAALPQFVMLEIRSDNTAAAGSYATYFDDFDVK